MATAQRPATRSAPERDRPRLATVPATIGRQTVPYQRVTSCQAPAGRPMAQASVPLVSTEQLHEPGGPVTLGRHRARVLGTLVPRGDVLAVLAGLLLLGTATIVGVRLNHAGIPIHVDAPPLTAAWDPHTGPGTPFAIALAVLAVAFARPAAERLPWRWLMLLSWCAAAAWTTSLALVDGWQFGWLGRLARSYGYLRAMPEIHAVGSFVRGFAAHIPGNAPDSWPTDVAGHPPGATLPFVLLDRAGLPGGGWAGALIVVVGSLAAVAVPVTIRALGAPAAARRVVPYAVFFPGTVWVGVSGDGMFMGVASCGIALAVVGAVGRGRGWPWCAFAGGMLLGLTAYLSYGLVLLGTVVAAAAVCTVLIDRRADGTLRYRRTGRWLIVVAGVLVVPACFQLAGFSWLQGLQLLRVRYFQGWGGVRPYSYFVWANLATLVLSAGPVAAAGLLRSLRTAGRPRRVAASDRHRAEVLVPAALTVSVIVAITVADLIGLSKGETERIWLPFALWLIPGLALLPRSSARWALAAQVLTALLVNHLLLTRW